MSKSREVGKGRVICKSVKSVIITVSAQKATSQLAEMVLIILTQSAPRHHARMCVCVCDREESKTVYACVTLQSMFACGGGGGGGVL